MTGSITTIILILISAILAVLGLVGPLWIRGMLLPSILSIDAIIILIYAITQLYYKPNVSLIVGGQIVGKPTPVPSHEGLIYLGVTTDLKKDVLLEEIRVEYDESYLHLSIKEDLATEAMWVVSEAERTKISVREKLKKDENGEIPDREYGAVFRDTTLNHEHSEALLISSLPRVKADFIHVYGLEYKSKNEEFSFLVKVTSKIEEYEIGPPWNMFNVGSLQHSELLTFKIDDEPETDSSKRLLRYGFPIAPGKTMSIRNISQKREFIS